MTPEERNQLVEDNMNLVYWYAARFSAASLDEQDLAQEGMLGLINAVERFDPNRGVRLSTYALWHIRKAIMSAIKERDGVVYTPRRQKPKKCSELEMPGTLVDTEGLPPDEELAEQEEKAVLHKAIHDGLRYLPEREAIIVQLRRGIHLDEPMTLRTVAALYGITPERVRQLQAAGEKKLRAHLSECATLEQGANTAERLKESAQPKPE